MKKTKSIKSKLMLSFVSITVLLSVIVLLLYSVAFNRFFDQKGTQALLDASKALERQFDDRLRLAGQTALRLACDKELRNAVVTGNSEGINRALARLVKAGEVDLCLVTDGAGRVLARTHRAATGDMMTGFAMVDAALAGDSITMINSGSATRLSLNGAAPILGNENAVVGTVMVGFRLDSDAYVDEAKRITGQEIMVFLGDECISTTLAHKNGQRMTGVKADPKIVAKVLAGEQYLGRSTLAGEKYLTCYSPLHNKGAVVGMIFSGLSMKTQGRALADFLVTGSTVSLAVLAMILVLAYFVVNRVVRPIHELAEAFQRVTDYMSSRDVCVLVEDLLPQTDTTEIDLLQDALRAMLAQLNQAYGLQKKSLEMELEKERILAASQAKDQVFANISHEIRTPMNAILGISDILLHEGGLTEQQRQYVRDVKISTENLLVIVNDVLDLSKLEAGKMMLAPVDYDFRLFLSNIESLSLHLAEEKGLRFIHTIEGETPKCLFGDDVRLRQILVNLLGNAIKFTHLGSVALSVAIGETFVRFSVSDTGIGIPADKMRLLFEAFEQLDTGAARQIGGTGLGLSICKHLTELMDGEIRVNSEYGRGSTFTVTVPKVLGDESRIRGWEEESAVAVARDARVLVVDDQRINLIVACGLIRALYGIECDTAQSGPECIQKAEQGGYDLIFMDHMMPGMDGIETVRELRKRGERLEKTPVIALTANVVSGMKEHLLENGMNGFLSKPIRKRELREVMLHWLGREESGPRAPGARRYSLPREWADIPGLNTGEGLENVGWQVDVYVKSLSILQKTIPGFIRTARELYAADDLHELAIHVHGMKSSLASVGAKELSGEFFAWERAFHASQGPACREALPALLDSLEAFGGVLGAVPPEWTVAAGQKSRANIGKTLHVIHLALSTYDYSAVVAGAECLKRFCGPEEEAVYAELFLFIEQFDYDQALEWLEAKGHAPQKEEPA